jgi:hypothetical protein
MTWGTNLSHIEALTSPALYAAITHEEVEEVSFWRCETKIHNRRSRTQVLSPSRLATHNPRMRTLMYMRPKKSNM